MIFPLRDYTHQLPVSGPNSFGATRRHDIHTGVDLFTHVGSPVLSMEGGEVVSIGAFTGTQANSSWWNDTDYILIAGPSGVILYGELETTLVVGDVVTEGQQIGSIKQVLKKDKGRPTSMLHLELYQHGYVGEGVIWIDGDFPPEPLLDPTAMLLEIINE